MVPDTTCIFFFASHVAAQLGGDKIHGLNCGGHDHLQLLGDPH